MPAGQIPQPEAQEESAHSDADSNHAGIEPDSDTESHASSIDPIAAYLTMPANAFLTRAMSEDVQDVSYLAVALLASVSSFDNPTYAEAMSGPHREEYLAAIAKEYSSLHKHCVFSEPVSLPAGKIAIGTKLVLKRKEAEHENAARIFKARLCGKGFAQQYGIDFHETFAPVAAYNSLRIFISLVASLDFECDCVDVVTAFLLAPLEEEVYIKIPDGYPSQPSDKGKVLRLLKSLYGLKQAPRAWNQELDGYLKSLGFKPTESERCIYVCRRRGETAYILVYVDDMLIATPNRKWMLSLKERIHSKFPITDKGPLTFFLNMHFTRDRPNRTITVHQQPKIESLLVDSRLLPEDLAFISKPCKTPASSDVTLTKEMCPKEPVEQAAMTKYPYKSFVGMLLYIAITARPDIAPAVSAAGRYAQNPGPEHWKAILHILRYLQGTRNFVLTLGGKCGKATLHAYSKVTAYADADWAGDTDRRRSRTGFVVFLGTSAVIWCSKLQLSVAHSSTEAEYVALSLTARDVIWARTLLQEMGFDQDYRTVIYEDNKSCINIAESYKQHPGIKHIDIRHHFIRERVLEVKDISIEKKSTLDMVADLFTKQLPFPAFQKHRASIGLSPR
jgi:hypothetical protein